MRKVFTARQQHEWDQARLAMPMLYPSEYPGDDKGYYTENPKRARPGTGMPDLSVPEDVLAPYRGVDVGSDEFWAASDDPNAVAYNGEDWELPNSYVDRYRQNYSGDTYNPQAPASRGRPKNKGGQEELAQDPLPLWGNNPPLAPNPEELYRGLTLDLGQPGMERIREMVHGTGPEDQVLFPRDPMQNLHNPTMGQAVLDYLDNPQAPTGMGAHWTQNENQARAFSHEYPNPKPENELPVLLRGEWPNIGEDTQRTNASPQGHDYAREKEITLLPGAPVNINEVKMPGKREPINNGGKGGRWKSLDVEPQMRQAMPTLYHYTNPEAAESIRSQRRFNPGRENGKVWLTTNPDSPHHIDSYGPSIVRVDVPDEYLRGAGDVDWSSDEGQANELNPQSPSWVPSAFNDGRVNKDWMIPADQIQPEWIRQAMPTLYHYTTPENAQSIREQGRFESPYGDPNAWFTQERGLQGFGDAEVAVNIPGDYPLTRVDPRAEHGIDAEDWIPIPSKDIDPQWIRKGSSHMRRVRTAREQYEVRVASWTPASYDPEELVYGSHPSGFSASTFPHGDGSYHHWIVHSPSGGNVARGKAVSPEEAQAAALHAMDSPPRPYRYGPDDLEFGLYSSPTNPIGGAAGVWSKGDEHGPENWLSGITWGPDGTIGHVETKSDHQRKGLATQLFDYVKQNHRPDLQHSTTLTPDGAAWSKAEQGRKVRTAREQHNAASFWTREAEYPPELQQLVDQYGVDAGPDTSKVFNAPEDVRSDRALRKVIRDQGVPVPSRVDYSRPNSPTGPTWGADDGRGRKENREWDTRAHDPRVSGDFERMVSNALSRYNGATEEQRTEGRNWYNAARIWLDNFVKQNGGDYSRAAAAMAALSPQLSWEQNLEGGAHFLRTYRPEDRATKWETTDPSGNVTGTGLPMLGTNVTRAMDIYDAEDPRSVMGQDAWGADGPKIHSFWKNFLGDENEVTIDKHMLRALDRAYGEDPLLSYGGKTKGGKGNMSPEDLRVSELEKMLGYSTNRTLEDGSIEKVNTGYNAFADAIRETSRRVNEGISDPTQHVTPAQMQAIIWLQHKGDMDAFELKNRRSEWESKNPGGNFDEYEEKRLSNPVPGIEPSVPMPKYDQAHGHSVTYRPDPKKYPGMDVDSRPRGQGIGIAGPTRDDYGVSALPVPADNIPDAKPTFNDMAGEQAMGTPGAQGSGLPTKNKYKKPDPLVAAREAIAFAREAIPKDITPEWERDVFNHVMRQQYPGVTLHDQLGDAPTNGYMSSYPDHEEKIPFHLLMPQDISDYASENRDLINSDPNNFLGGWAEDGQWYNDVSRNIKSPFDAGPQAAQDNQLAVYDLNQDTGVDTPDLLNQTQYKGTPGYYMAQRVDLEAALRNHGRREEEPWIW